MLIECQFVIISFFYGSLRFSLKEDLTIHWVNENKSFILKSSALSIISACLFKVIIDFLRNDSIKELLKRIAYQETTSIVMDNLDEILIVKNNKSLTYINKKGFEIIDEI